MFRSRHTTKVVCNSKNNLIKAAGCYTKTCKDWKLVLSGKAYICLSDHKLSCVVAKALRKEHIYYKPTHSARDVGVSYTAGVRHRDAGKLIRTRFTKTSKRNAKVGRLAKLSRRARVLFSGSQYSANTWGHQVTHLTQSQIDSLEKRGANATGITEAGRCRTMALIVGYGPRGHPIPRIIKELFTEWFRAVRTIARMGEAAFNNLRTAWGIARANLADKYSASVQHYKVHTVRPSHGIMHNVIIWLYKLGWNPMAIDRWFSPERWNTTCLTWIFRHIC